MSFLLALRKDAQSPQGLFYLLRYAREKVNKQNS